MVACGNSEVGKSSGGGGRPGRFSLSQLDGLTARPQSQPPGRAPLDTSGSSHSIFDLGDLKVSQSFFFLLQNVGGADISDVSLSTDNPGFVVSPARISVLPATGASTVPVVRVGVAHGRAIDGIGSAPLLPVGDTTSVLHAAGQSASTAVTLDADLLVHAKVMDAEILVDGTTVDLAHPAAINENDQFTGEGPYAMLPAPMTTNIALRNKGNVALEVSTKYGAGNHFAEWGAATVAMPGESQPLSYDFSQVSSQGPFSIRFRGDGAIAPPDHLHQSDTGYVYVAFYWNGNGGLGDGGLPQK